LIVLNQQVITGMQLEFNSHYVPVILIFVIGFIGAVLYDAIMAYASRHKAVIMGASIVVAVFFLLNAVLVQIRNNPFHKQENYLTPHAHAAINYFRDNHITDAVVYGPTDVGNKIILLTNNYLYFHGSQELHIMPTTELIDRFTYFDITNRHITEHPTEYQHVLFGHQYYAVMQKDNVIQKLQSLLLRKPFIPKSLDRYVTYDFSSMQEKRLGVDGQILDEHLKKYNVDYVIYPTKEHGSIYGDISGNVVFENETYRIIKRNKL